MFNRTITIDVLAVWACWIAGTLLTVGDVFNSVPDDSGMVGIVIVAFGHLVAVQRAHRQMDAREEVAFRLGRKSALRSIERV